MGIGNMHMAQVGGEDRQQTLRILIAAIPVHQSAICEAMPHIMQAWPVTVGLATQADQARQPVERAGDIGLVEPVASA